MKKGTLNDLFVDELKDLYNMENQLVKALPKMAKASNSEELSAAFEDHLEQTRGHVQRVEQILDGIGVPARGKKCAGMEGIIEEGKEVLEEDLEPSVLDAGIIGAAQRVEHYEIAAYGTARAHAELLGLDEAVRLLGKTLEEEKQANELLTQLSEDINPMAEEDVDDDTGKRERGSRQGNGRRRVKVGSTR